MFKAASAAALAAGLLFVATPAPAAQFSGLTLYELTGVLQNAGLSVATTSSKDVLKVGETFVWLTDCAATGRCAEISFFRNYTDVHPTLQAVNEWNNTKKLPEASLNPDGTLHMEMWLSGVGATDAIIADTFGWFERYAADTDFWGAYISQSNV